MASEDEIVAFVRERHRPEAIVLVGSRADGVARRGSDWDLYVLLPAAPGRPAGPYPAPASFAGELLDIALIHLPVRDDQVLALFGPNLQQARVLLDNAEGVAARLCERARQRYAAGRASARESSCSASTSCCAISGACGRAPTSPGPSSKR